MDQYGNVTTNRFDSQTGELLSSSTPNSDSRFTYDDDGNLEAIYDNRTNQRLVFNRYNNFGDVIETIDANGNQTFFEYDDLGNQIESWRFETFDVDVDGSPDQRFELRESTRYDDEGRAISTTRTKTDVTDPAAPITIVLSDSFSGNKNALGQDEATSSTNSQSGDENPQSEAVYDLHGQVIQLRRSAFDSNGVETWFESRTTYDSKGRVAYATDEYQVGTSVTEIYGSRNIYDAQDRVIKTQHLKGLNISIVGDVNLQQSNLATAGVVIASNVTEYDNAGRIKSSTSFKTSSTDSDDGLTTTYAYNRFSEPIEVRNESWNAAGDGKVIFVSSTVYDDFGRVFLTTDPWLEGSDRPVFATETLYDTQGRSYSTVRYEGSDVEVVDGETLIVDRGTQLYSSLTTYNDLGQVESSTAPDGQVTNYEHDDLGRRVAAIGASVVINGVAQRHRTETVYDARGRVSSEKSNIVHDESGNGNHDDSNVQQTSFHYDENGNVARTTFDDGSFAQVRYDELGRRIAESQQVAAGTALVWSEAEQSYVDNNFASGDPRHVIETRLLSYDTQGRLQTVSLPAVANPDNGGELERAVYEYGYDARGQQTSILDPLGRKTNLTYDELGRQTARKLPLHESSDLFEEVFDYDDRQRLSVQISFEGVYRVPVYDDVTGRTLATHYFEDAASYDSGNGTPDEIRTYSYDDYGRQIGTQHTINGTVTRTETMTYDLRGQLESVTNDEGVIRYRYDDLGRQIEVAFSGSDFQGDDENDFENVTTYSYDELGRLKSVSAIERNDQLVDVSTDTGIQPDTTTYQYDLVGNLDQTLYSNGLVHEYEYDDLNRLDELTHFVDDNDNGQLDAGEQIRATFDYEVRADGKRTSVTENLFTDDDAIADLTNVFDYDYDALGRLVQEELDSSDDSLDYVDSFVFDLVGNRKETTRDWGDVSKDDYTTSYQYDDNDRLTIETKDFVDASVSDSTTTYDYDQTQQTSKTVSEDGVITTTQTFEYNLQGRLASVTNTEFAADGVNAESITVTTYEYDSSGNRVSSENQVDSNADGIIDTHTETEFLTDSRNHTGYSQVLQETEFNADGVAVKKTVYTVGHDQINQTVFNRIDSDGDGIDAADAWDSGETHYFGTDGHGSVRVLYDFVGAIVNDASAGGLQLFHFDAYGNLLNFADGVTPLTSYLYSGEAFDFNIKQQYLRARFYDPATGRFNQLDPFSGNLNDPQSLHKYAYVHADPIQNIDPTGEFSIAGLSVSISGQSNLRGLNQGSVFRGLRAVGRVLDLIETLETFRGVLQLIQGSPSISRELRRIQNIINLGTNAVGNTGSARDFRKLRGLNQSHAIAITQHLISDLPKILRRISFLHSRTILQLSSTRRPTIVIALPTAPGRFGDILPLVNIGRVKRFRVALGRSSTGRGGSLFAVAFKFGNDKPQQVFRVDYHGRGNPTPRLGTRNSIDPRVINHGIAERIGPANGIGDPIQGFPNIGGAHKPTFHYHVPFRRR